MAPSILAGKFDLCDIVTGVQLHIIDYVEESLYVLQNVLGRSRLQDPSRAPNRISKAPCGKGDYRCPLIVSRSKKKAQFARRIAMSYEFLHIFPDEASNLILYGLCEGG